jgi:D-3-phosphoglycerate dehydrogenase
MHTPLTDETRGLINARTLARMKPGALLINTARGAVVDTDAVADALESGHLGGAGIDVLASEPATPSQRIVRLWQEDRQPPVNLILTPHTAYYSDAAIEEIRVKSAQEVARALRGETLRNPVNTWKKR